MDPLDVRPTHTVVFGPIEAATERRVTADALRAAAGRADRICLRIDREGLADGYPTLANRLRTEYDRTASLGGDEEYCTEAAANDPVLRDLLAIETWHLPVHVGHVRLERDGTTVVLYDADHRQFDVDADAAPEALAAIEAAFEGVAAGVLPRRTLCEWERNGTTYALSPPSFCVGSTCFGLGKLETVEIDATASTIRLRWDDSRPANRALALAVEVLERVGPTRPTTLRFDSRETFEAASAGFETVRDALADGEPST